MGVTTARNQKPTLACLQRQPSFYIYILTANDGGKNKIKNVETSLSTHPLHSFLLCVCVCVCVCASQLPIDILSKHSSFERGKKWSTRATEGEERSRRRLSMWLLELHTANLPEQQQRHFLFALDQQSERGHTTFPHKSNYPGAKETQGETRFKTKKKGRKTWGWAGRERERERERKYVPKCPGPFADPREEKGANYVST